MNWCSEAGSVGLLTLLILGTTDDLLASCCYTTIRSPAKTFNVAEITIGRQDGFIAAGLLFENHQRLHDGRRKGEGNGKKA